MKKLLLSLICLQSVFVFGQAPAIEWQKSYGGSGNDRARSIQQTTDGGYIVAGSSPSTNGDVGAPPTNSPYYWILKLNAFGNYTHKQYFGGGDFDDAYAVQQTPDASGYFYVVGATSSTTGLVVGNHGNYDYWKISLSPTLVFGTQKTFGGTGDDRAYSMQFTTGHGYILAGSSRSVNGDVTVNKGQADYWIVNVSASDNIIWQKSYGGSGYDVAQFVRKTMDGGFIVAGHSNSTDGDVTGNHGSADYWILKLNASGNITWKKSLGGTGYDQANCIQQTADGGYIVAGYSNSIDGDVTGNHGGADYWIVKLDATGSITWQKSLGGSGNDYANSVQQTTDGGYIVAGCSNSTDGDITGNHGNYDYWIVKLNASGNIVWQKSLGGSGIEGGGTETCDIKQTTDGGYIIAGSSSSNNGDVTVNKGQADYWIVKLSKECSPVTNTVTVAACESFTWTNGNGQTYTSSTTATHTIIGGATTGCDSTITLNLTINQPTTHTITATACGSYTLNTQTYTSSGTYTQTLTNANNCDSTITLNLIINQPTTHIITETVCESYTLNSQTYTSSGTYTQTLSNANNCDSTITLNLTINQPSTHTITETACESYTLNAQTYTSSGTYTQTLTNTNNCDSIITLNLTINQPSTHTITATACESYTLNSQTYTSSGTYTQTLTNANNCDSTITLNLTINQPSTHTITETTCESYTLNSQTYTSSGTYTQTLTNVAGCDSTITLTLTINQPTTHTITETACESYTLNTQTYTSSGTYTQTLTNANNCDSTITLNLTINHVDATVSLSGITLTANQTGASYQWIDCDNGNTPISGETTQSFEPTANGNYAVQVTANGCTETSTCTVVNSVGIDNNSTDVFQVFPNPGNGLFTVTGKSLNGTETIKITNALGQELHSKIIISNGTITVNLTTETPGVYFLEINKHILKLVKQ